MEHLTRVTPAIPVSPVKSTPIHIINPLHFVGFNVDHFYNNMIAEFGGKATGMGFAICQLGKAPKIYNEGYRRRSDNAPAAAFDVFETMHIASMSKTLTAIALQHVLHNKNISVNHAMAPYLPSNWSIGAQVANISFKMLLTHTSGFGSHNSDFASLKNMVAAGVNLQDQGVAVYQNANFGLMRVLIAKLNNNAVVDFSIPYEYINYVVNHVTYPATYASNIGCAPASIPTLYYNHDNPALTGWHTDDYTSSAGAYGWYLSVMQMAGVIVNLFGTEALLPQTVVAEMLSQHLGCYYKNDITHGGYYHHNGEWGDSVGRGSGDCWVYFEKTKHVVVIMMNSLPALAVSPETVAQVYNNSWIF